VLACGRFDAPVLLRTAVSVLQCVASGGSCTDSPAIGSPPADFTSLPSPEQPSTALIYAGLSAGTTYSCFIISYNSAAVNGVCSAAFQFATLPYLPNAATALVGGVGNPPQTSLVFTGFSRGAVDATHGAATSYRVQVGQLPLTSCLSRSKPPCACQPRGHVCITCSALLCARQQLQNILQQYLCSQRLLDEPFRQPRGCLVACILIVHDISAWPIILQPTAVI
jgi:hypothetical protein